MRIAMASRPFSIIWRIVLCVNLPLYLLHTAVRLDFTITPATTSTTLWKAGRFPQRHSALDQYDLVGGDSSSALCGGVDLPALADGTPFGWTGGITVERCAEKCAADRRCDAFERWNGDGACHWKSGATDGTARVDFPASAGHVCYLRRGRVALNHSSSGPDASPSALPALSPEQWETRVECTGECCHSLSANNRSCHYSNLYFEVTASGKGRFWAFVVAGNEAALMDRVAQATLQETRGYCQGPFVDPVQPQPIFGFNKPRKEACSTYNGTDGDSGFRGVFSGPFVKVFPTRSDLIREVSEMDKLENRPHVHVRFRQHANWGHHVMEGLYSSWMALSKFGLENRTICFVQSGKAGPARSELNPASTFGGCESQKWEELFAGPAGRWIHFHSFVFGTSGAGMIHRTRHFESSMYDPYGDVLYLPTVFRNRMFDRYSLPQPKSRSLSNEGRYHSVENNATVLRALIIPNKRDWGNIGGFAQTINERLRMVSLGGKPVTVTARILDWKTDNTMRRHLELIGQTDIYVSSVGTALTLQSLLSHGSIVVNAGWIDGYWDEYMTAAIRYLDAVYPQDLGERRSNETMVDLVRKAAMRIINGFRIPVPRGKALSPIGRAISTFMRSPEGENLHIWEMINAQWQWDGGFGQFTGGCNGVVGSAQAAFAWACGMFNSKCHPSREYMVSFRQKHRVACRPPPELKSVVKKVDSAKGVRKGIAGKVIAGTLRDG